MLPPMTIIDPSALAASREAARAEATLAAGDAVMTGLAEYAAAEAATASERLRRAMMTCGVLMTVGAILWWTPLAPSWLRLLGGALVAASIALAAALYAAFVR